MRISLFFVLTAKANIQSAYYHYSLPKVAENPWQEIMEDVMAAQEDRALPVTTNNYCCTLF